MELSTRQLVYLGIFGALWGVVEMSLGSLLHILNVPMTGLFISAIGLMIAFIARYFVPRRGSTLFIGAIAALLKMVSLGGIVIWPMIAILMEAVVGELVLSAFGEPHRTAFVVAGALGVFYSLIHPFLSQGLLAGRGALFVWEMLIEQGNRLFNLPPSAPVIILGILAILYLAVGAAAGVLAWNIARLVGRRSAMDSNVGSGKV